MQSTCAIQAITAFRMCSRPTTCSRPNACVVGRRPCRSCCSRGNSDTILMPITLCRSLARHQSGHSQRRERADRSITLSTTRALRARRSGTTHCGRETADRRVSTIASSRKRGVQSGRPKSCRHLEVSLSSCKRAARALRCVTRAKIKDTCAGRAGRCYKSYASASRQVELEPSGRSKDSRSFSSVSLDRQ